MKQLVKGLNESAKQIHQNNKEKGFWDEERNVGELLMLVTSELGEAMEAHRKGRFAKLERLKFELSPTSELTYEQHYAEKFQYHVKDTFEDEIADAIIRLLDLSAGLNIDIERHINAKVAYNKTREKLHGKLY
jgi:NTP pyrophosphatase (non-canonical NTP hydrolase)